VPFAWYRLVNYIENNETNRTCNIHGKTIKLRAYIQKFPDYVDNEIYSYNN